MGPNKNNNSKVEGEKCGEEAEPGQTERPHPMIFFKTEETKNCEEKRRSTGGETENMDRLTASVELLLLQARCSQLSLWFFSSGVQEARKALWMTRLGVLVKEKARVTWRAHVVRW